MSHHSTVLMFHVSPPPLLDRLDSTLVPTRSRMGTSRLLASGGFDKGNGHSRSMLTRDLGPYPFKSPQSSVAATYKLYVGEVLDYGVWKVVWSLEKILDHVWSFLYVNQAGGLEGSSDASSVSVKESRLMRNSQPIYVTRWLATCCCAEEVATWWRSALLWRTFFSTAVVVVVLRAFMEYCKSGECGLFGEGGLIMFDVSGVSVNYHLVDLIPVTVIGIIGGVLGSLYNYVLHKVLRLYNLINEKGKLAKILLSLSVSLFTSACLYGLPFLASCTPCDPSAPLDTECPSTGRMGNFKKFNCPKGHYNDLATLLLTTNDDAVRNIFSTNTPSEYRVFSLFIFFILYCILGLFTFGIAVPSGLFLPIILMGSAYGRLLGMAMGPYTTIDQGLFAVLGAASLMAGSMRMTVSLCVIFLELTNNLLLLPITMLVLLISKSVGDCFNPSIYEIILELKGLPFLEAHPEPWMRNITVGELADVKPPMVTLSGIEKVGRIVEVLRNTTHNAFAVVDNTMVPMVGQMSEVHGLVLRAHLLLVLKKKWFLQERRRTEEWEVREKFTWVDVAERWGTIEEVAVTKEEMEMYVDLHPLTNTTPYTVVETMSVAKALVQFRQVGLRHMLVLPKYHGPSVPPVVGILTRQDLRAHNILSAFPHLEKSYASKKGR
ncbi:putative CBS domain, chloride channel, voltage gated, chloride channel, core [Helianthus annuus]|nr:putative CBS domain, chloride channel, voltage gated, chloride channel, core [Helianthus annuus]